MVTNWAEKQLLLDTGIHMAYAELGPETGKPAVLIHGATDSRLSWIQVGPCLAAKGYHVYIPELRGHGKTDRPQAARYTLQEHEADILSLIEKLGLKRTVLVGHSLGTMISQKIAADHPELVTSLTLIGAGYQVEKNDVIDWILDGDADTFQGLNRMSDEEELPDAFVRDWAKTENPMEGLADAIYQHAKGLPTYVWRAIFAGTRGINISEDVKKITAPVQIIWGTEDVVFPRELQDGLLRCLVNAKSVRFQEFPGQDHNTHWASEAVAKQVTELIVRNNA